MDRKRAQSLLIALAALGAAVALADAWLLMSGGPGAHGMLSAWPLVFGVLTTMWVEADSRREPRVYRTYEFGLLVYLVWPLYLPYYLAKTRGALGILWLGAFGVVFALSWPYRLFLALAA